MRLSVSVFTLAIGAGVIPQAFAWGAVGHEVVATIAEMHLHPSVMPKLCVILDKPSDCFLAPVATWADTIRRVAKYRWTAPLHYIGAVGDYPSSVCAFPGTKGWEGRTHINVLNSIRNTTNVLQEYEQLRKAGAEDVEGYVQDALKFLIHFMGDMHMPLHLTGRNRGGNSDKVCFDGRSTNLHSLWDGLLIAQRLRTLPSNYTEPLPISEVEYYLRDTIYDPYIRRLVWEGLLGKWEDEIDSWLDCPSPESFREEPTSAWQRILSRMKGTSSSGDGGLGVDDANLCPYNWAKPIHQLNCEIVFPKALDELRYNQISPVDPEHQGHVCDESHIDEYDASFALQARKCNYFELDTPEYSGVIKDEWIIEKLLTQGGVRLAAVLNWVFADVEDGVQPRFVRL
ncbi:phospholipase C/P1 nuclease domain-containing protein [Melanogaster broomeanus]|nr:phospholipase C/P1 nuclease domain-containing protein [Melanogaster broomeanus]